SPLRAGNPTLTADVGAHDGIVISLVDGNGDPVTTLAAGTYTIVVHDHSAFHNFHLSGPGVDRSTSVQFVGDATWTVTVSAGSYHFQCDAHPSLMKGDITVTAPPKTFALSVAKQGAGSGSVASNPAGIDCVATCSASFE